MRSDKTIKRFFGIFVGECGTKTLDRCATQRVHSKWSNWKCLDICFISDVCLCLWVWCIFIGGLLYLSKGFVNGVLIGALTVTKSHLLIVKNHRAHSSLMGVIAQENFSLYNNN